MSSNTKMSEESNNNFRIPYLPTDAPMAEIPSAFKLELYAHQRRSLYRMLQIENEGIQKFNFGGYYGLDYETQGGCICDAVGLVCKLYYIIIYLYSYLHIFTKGKNSYYSSINCK